MPHIRLLPLFILLFMWTISHGQVGLRMGYDHLEANHISVIDRTTGNVLEGPGTAYSLGLDYWFRLPNKRIEFYPEINAALSNLDLPDGNQMEGQWYSFFFNTHIYLLDLLNDCDCPTFSKQNKTVQRGFFVSLSPGVTYSRFSYDSEDFSPFEREHSDWIFSLAGGLGLDLGLSDLVTLTPFAEARYLFPFEGPIGAFSANDQIPPDFQLQSAEAAGWRLRAGVRLGFRFDYQ